MIIKNKYFSFELVNLKNIETLRKLRNSDKLRKYMHFTKYISKQEQISWFNKLDKKRNLYFIAKKNNEIIGYTMIKGIDFDKMEGEPGTFLLDTKLLESSEAALFMISFLDFCYFELNIKIFYGNVLKTNKRALLNYSFFDKKEMEENEKGITFKSKNAESYLHNTKQIRKALKIVFGYDLQV